MFSNVAGFWLRGGLTYHSADSEFILGNGEEWGLAFTFDPTFVLSPADHFAFLAGFNLDWDFTGKYDPAGPAVERDRYYRSFGIQLGLLGYL